jgi:hypothetical protein
VLKCIQAVIGQFRHFFTGGPDSEDTAGVLRSLLTW